MTGLIAFGVRRCSAAFDQSPCLRYPAAELSSSALISQSKAPEHWRTPRRCREVLECASPQRYLALSKCLFDNARHETRLCGLVAVVSEELSVCRTDRRAAVRQDHVAPDAALRLAAL